MIIAVSHDGSDKIAIRMADCKDAAALAKLRYIFRSAAADGVVEPEDCFLSRCRKWMCERLRDSSRWKCWVAESEQTIVGNLWLQVIDKIPNPLASEPEHHAYISNMYVREEYQDQAIGSQLLTAAWEWIEHQDIHSVILWPTEAGRQFYARHGFGARDDLMQKWTTRSEAATHLK